MKQKYLTLFLTAVVVLTVLIAAYLLLSKNSTYAPSIQTQVQTIENPNDLQRVDSQLEEDLSGIDSSLDQLDKEAASF